MSGLETSLAVQWLRLRASSAGGMGSIPGQETTIPQAARHGQKIKFFEKRSGLEMLERKATSE